MADEEDDLDAYMRTLDVPEDFLKARHQHQHQQVATLEDVLAVVASNASSSSNIPKDLDAGAGAAAATAAAAASQADNHNNNALHHHSASTSTSTSSSSSNNNSNNDDGEDAFFQALLSQASGGVTPTTTTAATTTAATDKKETGNGGIPRPNKDEEEDGDGDEDGVEEKSGVEVAMELLKAKAKKKEIRLVDHSKIAYPPFRKDFYVEAPDIAQLSKDDVRELMDEFEIKVHGKDPPRPIASWEQCGLSQKLLETIRANGWEAPFAIQRQALPAIMSGRDVMGIAQTGSGKTLAYLVPLIRHVKDQRPVIAGEGPIALLIAPTRELATQIQKEVNRFKKSMGVECVCLYGGQNVGDQISSMRKGVAAVVGTPGRLIDVLSGSGKNLPLNRVTFVVLDEADRLFDMGFTPQVEKILANVRPDRQTVMFSATFPAHVEKLAKEALHKPLHIVVGNARSGAKVSADVDQVIEVRSEAEKFPRLLQLLGEWFTKGNVLVFCDSQVRVDSLFQELDRVGYSAVTLHAGKDQMDRDYAIKDFKNKVKTLMIATGVAGRGLDVPDLNLVVNFNCPNHLQEYVHRVGRTGRAGKKGMAVTFLVDPDDAKYAADLVFVLKVSNQPVPERLAQMADEFKKKLAEGTEKHHPTGYSNTKGYAFERGQDVGGYEGHVKRLRTGYVEMIRGENGGGSAAGGAATAASGGDAEVQLDADGDVVTPVPAPPPPPSSSSSLLVGATAKSAASLGAGGHPPPSTALIITGSSHSAAPAPAPAVAAAPALVLSDSERRLLEAQNLQKQKEIAKAKALALGLNVPTPAPSTAAMAMSSMPTHMMLSGQPPSLLKPQQHGAGGGAGGAAATRPQTHFTKELDINDLPNPVRMKITSKRAMNNIENEFRVSLTVKGNYYPPGGKPAQLGERKLHMVVEANDAQHLKSAVEEITRQIQDEASKISADQAFNHLSGIKYTL